MITLKSATELEAMRQSSRIMATVLGELEPLIRPGIRTRDLDLYAEKRTRELGAVPAFKGYRGLSRLGLHLGQRGDHPRHPLGAHPPGG